MSRKKIDPRLASLHEQEAKATADCDRWWKRLRRAFKALEKAHKRLASAWRRIEKHKAEVID